MMSTMPQRDTAYDLETVPVLLEYNKDDIGVLELAFGQYEKEFSNRKSYRVENDELIITEYTQEENDSRKTSFSQDEWIESLREEGREEIRKIVREAAKLPEMNEQARKHLEENGVIYPTK